MKKPNLFIVGHQKSGTSALYKFLKQHPDIFMSYIKEPFYFAEDLLEEKKQVMKLPYYTTKKGYMDLFRKWKNEKIAGEASTVYLYSKVAAKKIHDFNPDAKIIMMLREPVSYLYSLHMQGMISNGEDQDFETALKLEDDRRKGKNLPNKYAYRSYFYYSDWCKYSEHVQRYLKLFPKKNIKIIIFEDFKKDNIKIAKEVFRFLGVDDSFTPKVGVVNPSKKVRFPRLKFFLENSFNTVKRFLPQKFHRLLAKSAGKILFKKQERVPLNAELKKQLMRKYKPEVARLSKLLNIDLEEKWGYK